MTRIGTRAIALTSLLLGAGSLGACRSAPPPLAFDNVVFYHYGAGASTDLSAFEQRYPPLDLEREPPALNYIGVKVLQGTVRLSRPDDWVLRTASNEPAKRYVEYVSPRQLLVSIYERVESPAEPWLVIMNRYESELEKSGGRLLSQGTPTATWNGQARAYTVERKVAAPKAPFVNKCREYLVRSKHRILLVQLVYQDPGLGDISDEALRVIDTMQVL